MAVHGETVVVGAHLDNANDDDADSGAAFVFTKPGNSGWANATETAKLTASDGVANDKFGISVSLDDDTVVVGAHQPQYEESGANVEVGPGAAYVFTKPVTGGWTDNTEGANSLPPTARRTTNSGSRWPSTLMPSWLERTCTTSVPTPMPGAAYVFTRDSNSGKWGQPLKLTASNGHADDGFGTPLRWTAIPPSSGRTWTTATTPLVTPVRLTCLPRELGVWSQTLNLAGPGPDQNDRLGYSVAVDDGTLLAGAPQDDNDPGFAYAMDISDAE